MALCSEQLIVTIYVKMKTPQSHEIYDRCEL